MPFQNVIMPDVSIDSMHGVFKLLALIGTPAAEESAAFLNRLIAEKDAAVAAQAAAVKLRDDAAPFAAEAQKAKAEMEGDLRLRQDSLNAKHAKADEASKALALASANMDKQRSEHEAEVAMHKDHITTANLALLTRDNALTAREQKLARDMEELDRKQRAFDEHMAPVLAAAKLAASA